MTQKLEKLFLQQIEDNPKEEVELQIPHGMGSNGKKVKVNGVSYGRGGSCNPTTWRTDVAIPLLKRLGISYYNPWRPELIEQEWTAKENAEVLFFVIDNQTRGIVAMIESAFISGSKRKLILVFNEWAGPGTCIQGEPISEKEFIDLREGQSYLQDIVERQGIPIFDEIPVALATVARILHETGSPHESSTDEIDSSSPVRINDRLIRMREVFDSIDSQKKGEITFADLMLAFSQLSDRELTYNSLRQILIQRIVKLNESDQNLRTLNLDEIGINFEDFCCIVNEFKSQISTNKRFGQNLVKKLELIFEPISRASQWLFKPVNSALKSANSPQHIPFEVHTRDIYLGGSASQSITWRDDIAIPLLRKYGLTYYSSQSEALWSEDRMIPIETANIEKSRVLLFVITNNARALSAMILAAHYVALGCNVVLCIQYLDDECVIDGEKLTATAIKDYNRGRAYLSDMANRKGLTVLSNINEAVISCVRKCIFNNNVLIDNINTAIDST